MQKFVFFCFFSLIIFVATTPRTHVSARTADDPNERDLASNPTLRALGTGGGFLGIHRTAGRSLAGFTWQQSHLRGGYRSLLGRRRRKGGHGHKHKKNGGRGHKKKGGRGHGHGHKKGGRGHKKGGHGHRPGRGHGHGHNKRDIRSKRYWYDMFKRRHQRRYGGGPPRESSEDSASITRLRGVLIIVAYGDGDMCFTKVYQRGMAVSEQFGDSSTSTNGFIDLYGEAECEEGARGFAYGVVKASVLAEAKRRGTECEAKVISEVMVKVHDLDPDDGVSVLVNGAAGGEALAVCD